MKLYKIIVKELYSNITNKMIPRNNCVICNSSNFKDIYIAKQYPLLFTPPLNNNSTSEFMDLHFVGCLECGCVQLKTLADPQKLYEDAYNVTCNFPLMRIHHEKFADFILQNLINKNQLFEIGGSNGALARIIKGKIDIKYTILDLCDRNPNIEGVDFIQGNCEDIEFPDNTTLIMSHVFEHLYKPSEFVKNISKKNINQIIISNPDMMRLLNKNDLSFINFEHTYFCDTVYLDYLFNSYGYYRKDILDVDENTSIFYNYIKVDIKDNTEFKNVDLNDAEALLDAEALGVFGGIPTNERYEAKLKQNIYLLEKIQNYLLNREYNIKNLYLNKPTYICPAGNYGQLIYYFLSDENKQKIMGFLDGDSFKIGKLVYGTNLNTFKKDKINEHSDVTVIICVSRYRDEIKQELISIQSNVNIIDI